MKTNFCLSFSRFIIIVGLYTLPQLVYGQSHNIDEANFKSAMDNLSKNPDSALYYIKTLKKSQNQCRALFAKVFEATLFYNENKYGKSTEILKSVLNEIETQQKPETFTYSELMFGKTYKACIEIIKLNVYRRFFYIRKNEKKLKDAYDYLLLAENIVNHLPEKNTYYLKNKISIAYSMASLKKVLGANEESLNILLELIKEIDSTSISKSDYWFNTLLQQKANIYVQIGRNYMYLEKENPDMYGLAEQYFEQAFQNTQRIDPFADSNKASHHLRLAELYLFRKQYDSALKLTIEASKYYNKDKYIRGLYKIKAACYSNLKQPDSAIFYASKVLNNTKNIGLKYDHAELYSILSENYYAINKLDSAYKYSELTINTLKIVNTEKEKTSRLLKDDALTEALLLNQSINKKRKQSKNRFIITILLSVLVFGSLVYYNRYRRKHLNLKLNAFKNQLEVLSKPCSLKKETPYIIDDETTKRILDGLTAIENSTIFTDKDFSLSVLAKLLNTNTSYLSRIINEHKKQSFKQYLNDLRIAFLMKNLSENPITKKYSIEALANSIGYTNASSFTRIFKNHTGMSPSQYLKNTA